MKVLLNTLYVQTQGSYLRLDHDTLKIEVEKQTTFQIPLHHWLNRCFGEVSQRKKLLILYRNL
jgi:CRISPR-associated protein Cas1